MYAYIQGTVAALTEETAVIDNHGIGYRIFMPGSSLQELRIGDEKRIHTHFAVRDDALQLYGFLTEDELSLFRMLLGVSGVGPKGALGILTVFNADDLRFAILSEDAAGISRAPGIGKKTAQKVILELKDKMDLQDAFEQKAAHTAENASKAGNSAQSEAVAALTALGYGSSEAMKAVKKVSAAIGDTDTQTILKAALKELF